MNDRNGFILMPTHGGEPAILCNRIACDYVNCSAHLHVVHSLGNNIFTYGISYIYVLYFKDNLFTMLLKTCMAMVASSRSGSC